MSVDRIGKTPECEVFRIVRKQTVQVSPNFSSVVHSEFINKDGAEALKNMTEAQVLCSKSNFSPVLN